MEAARLFPATWLLHLLPSPPPVPPPPLHPRPTLAAPAAPPPPPAASLKASPLVHFAAGWLAASVSAVLLSPLEVLKTKQQSSLRPALGARADRLLLHIVRTEGAAGLYRGLVPTLLGVGPTRAIFFGGYNFLKQQLEGAGAGGAGGGGAGGGAQQGSGSSHLHLLAAAVASMASVTITSPVWVVKTRLQLQSGSGAASAAAGAAGAALPHYAGVLDAFRKIYAAEGARAFYRGLTASYLGVVETSLQFVLYDRLKAHVVAQRLAALPPSAVAGKSEAQLQALAYSGATSFWTSALTKFVVAVVTYPHEVLRTRMREGSMGSSSGGSGGSGGGGGGGASLQPRYATVAQSVALILREEGLRGLYGGMGVHLLRTVPNAAILLLVVEYCTGGQV